MKKVLLPMATYVIEWVLHNCRLQTTLFAVVVSLFFLDSFSGDDFFPILRSCVRRYWNSSPAPGLLLSESVSYHTWTTAIIIILLHAFRRLCGICSFRADTQNLVCRTSFIHFNLRRCLNPISKHTHTHSSHSHSCPFILITYFVIS